MRVAVAGAPGRVEGVQRSLAAAGIEVLWDGITSPGPGEGTARRLAELLVAFEARLDADSPATDAVVLADTSDAALAAALVATKVPLAVINAASRAQHDPGSEAEGANARLIAALADASVGSDPAAIVAAVRDAEASRAGSR